MRLGWFLCIALVGCQGNGDDEGSKNNRKSGDESDIIDLDGDGVSQEDDCDDNDAAVFPGNDTDVMGDGIDQNCDGHDGIDSDGDGYGNLASGGDDCDDSDPTLTPADVDQDGFSTCDGDCDDSTADVAPGRPEACDGIDTDCDGALDEDADGEDLCARSNGFQVGGSVDVLFVIDNSCSMYEEQVALANNGVDFLTPLIGYDIHVGVISTDMRANDQSGRLRQIGGQRWIDATYTQEDAEDFFDQAVVMGTGGNFEESGRDAAYEALAVLNNGYNAGYSRADAAQHIVVLSDEDDNSSNVTVNNFITWMSTFKAIPEMTQWHAIVSPDPVCPTAAQAGLDYLALTTATLGMTASICAPDYGPLMSSLAQSILPILPDDLVFPLEEVPDEATLEVWLTEQGQAAVLLDPADWTYDAATNSVSLVGLVVADGSTIEITYRMAI